MRRRMSGSIERPQRLPYTRGVLTGLYPVMPRLSYQVDYLDRMIKVQKPKKKNVKKSKKPSRAEFERKYRKLRQSK